MTSLSLVAYRVLPADWDLPRICGFALCSLATGDKLYAATRYGGFITTWALDSTGPTTQAAMAMQRADSAGAMANLSVISLGASAYMLSADGSLGAMMLRQLNADGSYGTVSNLGVLSQFGGDLIAMNSVALTNGTTAVYGGILGGSGIARLSFGAGAALSATTTIPDTATTFADRVVALAQTNIDTQTYLFSASSLTPGVTSWAVAANGDLQAVASIGAAEGLWINTPTALKVAHVGAETFLIVAAAGSDSLSVMRIEAGGALRMASHVLDDLNSRFAGVTALASVEVDGRSYLAAAGSDDGLTLFQVLPGGRLLALDTIADTDQSGLANISALSMRASATGLDIFVGSSQEAGLTQLHYNLGTAGLVKYAVSAGEDLFGASAEDTLCGGTGNDRLYGGAGADILLDGAGSDQMTGGSGADVFVLSADDSQDTITDFTLGQDKIDLSAWNFLRNIDQLQMTSTATGITITFGAEVLTVISANLAPLQASQFNWSDLYNLNQVWTDPTLIVEPPLEIGQAGDLVGAEANDTLTGDAQTLRIFGLGGDDQLISQNGQTKLYGMAGDDSYYVSGAEDRVFEAANAGFDTVYAAANYTLTALQSVEMLCTVNSALTTQINLTGNTLSQSIYGNAGNNILNSGGGAADLMAGLGGNDDYYVYNSADAVYEAENQGWDVIYSAVSYQVLSGQSIEVICTTNWGGTEAINLTGNELSQTIYGNAGNNILSSGGGAADQMAGQGGDDVYYVYNSADVVYEAANQGRDTVYSAVTYKLLYGQSIELMCTANWTLTTALNLTGNEQAQSIYGNSGNNVLNTGGGAADRLVGLEGNDIYFVYNSADLVLEAANQGRDTVYSAVSYKLLYGQSIEVMCTANWTLTTALNLTGNEQAQSIYGNSGNNVLNTGGGAADILLGLAGNDIYYVSNAADKVYEAANEGADTVYASVSYALLAGQSIEVMCTSNGYGSEAINLTGNELSQSIYGNAGNNVLNSGGGAADRLVGLEGNDIYFVYNSADLVLEAANQGRDTVYSAVSYKLLYGQSIEVMCTANWTLTTALSLTGNEQAQSIYGNSGNNVLNTGGGAADILLGLAGNDIYYVSNAADKVYEAANEGADTVYASVSYALLAGQSIEVLATSNATANGAINLTGNELAQTLYGNAGANVLTGGAGADTLFGGGGADSFVFNTALGPGQVDFIADFAHTVDRIHLDNAVFTGLADGALAPINYTSNAAGKALSASDRIIYQASTGMVFYDADGTGPAAAVQFAAVTPGLALWASDFLVI